MTLMNNAYQCEYCKVFYVPLALVEVTTNIETPLGVHIVQIVVLCSNCGRENVLPYTVLTKEQLGWLPYKKAKTSSSRVIELRHRR